MPKALKNLLSSYGYNLVALPKEDIHPLLLLYKNNADVSSMETSLKKIFPEVNSTLPVADRDTVVTGMISGDTGATYDVQGGISMLDWLLQKLHMGKLSAGFDVDGASSVKISYGHILEDKVDLGDLDNYISLNEPDTAHFNTFRKKLEDSELYVVTHVLKSNSFSITVSDKDSQKIDVEAKVKGIVDANVNVAHSKDKTVTLTHEDVKPVVFAFKAQRIIYDKKKWWQFGKKDGVTFRLNDQQGVVLKSDEAYPSEPLPATDEPVDL